MKTKILMSILMIGVVAMAAGAGTFAYFSDIETSTGNSFTAGVIDLVVDSENPLSSAQVTLPDMKPCTVAYIPVTLSKTDDSNGGDVWIHINNVKGLPGISSEPERAVGGDDINNIQDWITFDLYIDVNENGVVDSDDKVIIHPDDHMKLGDLECVWIKIGWLDKPIQLLLSFHLQAETPNEYQGDTCEFDLDYMMQQIGAEPPGNKIILENKDGLGPDGVPETGDETWEPILGDGVWGIAEYNVGSLTLDVEAHGLPTDGRNLQIGMTSPEVAVWYPVDPVQRVAMASALASAIYDGNSPGTAPPVGFNLFERGYNPPGSGTLYSTYSDGYQGTYIVATARGEGSTTAAQADSNGDLDWSGNANLPSGSYCYIKLLVKDDAPPWVTYLMEKDTPMFFTIP